MIDVIGIGIFLLFITVFLVLNTIEKPIKIEEKLRKVVFDNEGCFRYEE